MAVLGKEDFMNKVRERIGDDTSDEALAFVEDMNDTFNDLESRTQGISEDEVNERLTNLDNEWREKYKARFFEGVEQNNDIVDDEPTEEEHAEEVTIDDLFTESEE